MGNTPAWTEPDEQTTGTLITKSIYDDHIVNNLAYLRLVVEPAMKNLRGSAVEAGDVVVVDTSEDAAFNTTTTADHASALGVVMEAIADQGTGRVAVQGQVTVKVQGNVSRGNWLRTSGTDGRAEDAGQYHTPGSFAVAVSSYSGGGAGTVTAQLIGFVLGNLATPEIRASSSAGLKLSDDAGTVGVFVEDGGQVGINTATPGQVLDVNGAAKMGGTSQYFIVTDLGVLTIYTWNGSGHVTAKLRAAGNDQLVLHSNSNVGINTGSPAYTLDVAGNCHASSFPTSSDQRLKRDVRDITGALDMVSQLRGVRFKWNEVAHFMGRVGDDDVAADQIGFVAQEFEAVLPELVSTWDGLGNEQYRGIDYSRVCAVLVEAVKELTARVEVLENANNNS
ncbi:MAG: tail fiber domain-containing protein [Chloroflexota bacterium]